MTCSATVRRTAFLLSTCALVVVPAFAVKAGERVCLNKAEQSAAVAAHQVIPLAEAIKTMREHGHPGEVVRVRLCRREGTLDYVLTMLSRSGKVISADLDAANGELITGR
jgi:uncharacterized membrane protein YkoI